MWKIEVLYIKNRTLFLLNNLLATVYPNLGGITRSYIFQIITFSICIFCKDNKSSYKNPYSKCALSLNPLILRQTKGETEVFPFMERNVWANVCGRDVSLPNLGDIVLQWPLRSKYNPCLFWFVSNKTSFKKSVESKRLKVLGYTCLSYLLRFVYFTIRSTFS